MCGIVGRLSYKKDLSTNDYLIKKMTRSMEKRGPDDEGIYIDKFVNLGHRRLNIVDCEKGKQPMKFKLGGKTYVIVCNGTIYNCDELKEELIDSGFSFETHLDTEILLKGYISFGEKVLEKINGVFAFAIWDEDEKTLFLARDHFGIKPLFYTWIQDEFLFSSEIKGLLENENVKRVLDEEGIKEILGLGPDHTPGESIFKNIKEINPASFVKLTKEDFDKKCITEKVYWKPDEYIHTDSFEDTVRNIRYLIEDSVKKQLKSDVPLGCLLSGGLDSSIIVGIASKYYKDVKGDRLKTFSVDYIDNDKNFVKNDFQPNQDDEFINLMVNKFDTEHKKIVLDTPQLFNNLENAMIAKDMPGMADIDTSMMCFLNEVKKDVKVVLSGECSDEIFGGYPWYFKETNNSNFPWSNAIEEREKLLNKDLREKINLKDYIKTRYNEEISNVSVLESDSDITKEHKKKKYLTTRYFMQTLLDRTDRMCSFCGIDVRVPFCDYRIYEYLWNIPWEMKAYLGREKGLLRYVFKDLLPKEIVERKKSPYPKTFNPNYLEKVKSKLLEIIKNKDSKLNKIVDKDFVLEVINTNGDIFKNPWFGQLMRGPQFMAYLIQVEMWLEKYNVSIDI